MLLSEEQWSVLAPLFPEPKRRRDGRGRPSATNRACFQGILWVLRTGARWRDLRDEYPDGSTCWRRLRMWEEQGIWLRAWRKLLAQMDERNSVGLGRSISGRYVRPREKSSGSARHVEGRGRSAWWWSTAAAYLSERNLGPRRFPNVYLRRAHSDR